MRAKGSENSPIDLATQFGWKYFMPSAEQSSAVQVKLNNDSENLTDTKISDVSLIDVSMGSGHILVYAFEVFMQIYISEGYSKREATISILENNIFGLDIDTRAFQLSYFSIMMQARKYNRRILSSDIKPKVFDIPEYDDLDYKVFSDFVDQDTLNLLKNVIETFKNGNNYGSLIHFAGNVDWEKLKKVCQDDKIGQLSFNAIETEQRSKELIEILNVARILSSKYTINVTNPPYMGSGKMNSNLSKYVGKNYPNGKSDLFATFMERTKELTKQNGYYALITMHSWMFLSSFEKLRNELTNDTLINMAHLGTRAFEDIGGEVVQSTAFVFQNKQLPEYIGTYERLVDYNSQDKKETAYLEAVGNPQVKYLYRTNQANFSKIPGSPIAYWASPSVIDDFLNEKKIGDYVETAQGITTGDNDLFLKRWFEIKYWSIGFNCSNITSEYKWYPLDKGGKYRKWYGNIQYVIWYDSNSIKLMHTKKGFRHDGKSHYFDQAITWSDVNSSKFSLRFRPKGCIQNAKGQSAYSNDSNLLYILAYMNSPVGEYLIKMINPTISLSTGYFKILPNKQCTNQKIEKVSMENIQLSKNDWNKFEISWRFARHPLLNNIADDKQLFNIFPIRYNCLCAKFVTIVPVGGEK